MKCEHGYDNGKDCSLAGTAERCKTHREWAGARINVAPTQFTKDGRVAYGTDWQLAHANCLDAVDGMSRLADGICDAIITDPPFSKRTHEGHRTKTAKDKWSEKTELGYEHITLEQVKAASREFARLSRGWINVMADHDVWTWWEDELKSLGLYTFPPVPIVTPGMTVRRAGDGPSSWTIWLLIARHRSSKRDSTLGEKVKWGTKKGAYLPKDGAGSPLLHGQKIVKGAKPPALLETIVRDYTIVGETVIDPFAGSGSTGVACIRSGRKFIGWEEKREHFELAASLIGDARRQLTVDDQIQVAKRRPPQGEQQDMAYPDKQEEQGPEAQEVVEHEVA